MHWWVLFGLILLEFDSSSTEFEDLLKPPLLLTSRISQNLFFYISFSIEFEDLLKPPPLLCLRIFKILFFTEFENISKPHLLPSLKIWQNLVFYWVWGSLKTSSLSLRISRNLTLSKEINIWLFTQSSNNYGSIFNSVMIQLGLVCNSDINFGNPTVWHRNQ